MARHGVGLHAGGQDSREEDAMTRTIVTLFMLTMLFMPGSAEPQDKPADGTVRLSQGVVAAGIGYTWGGGTLSYKGKSYPLKVSGLSVGQAGISKAEATGNVFNLTRVEDFDGNYTAAGVEGTIAGGGGATALRNQNGVVIYLTTTTRGLNFKVAAEGVQITRAQ
jgi:hypothetical protein